MNVLGAWALGYTGKGIVVTILDDGIEHNHTDLIQNYVRYRLIDISFHPRALQQTFHCICSFKISLELWFFSASFIGFHFIQCQPLS